MQRDVLWIALHSARAQTVLFLFQRGNSTVHPLEITGLTFDHGVETSRPRVDPAFLYSAQR